MRHLGVPASGAADPLSLALANRLVDNDNAATGLEITLTGISLRFGCDTFIAITGAKATVTLNSEPAKQHRRLRIRAGDEIVVGAAEAGARNYLAVAGGLVADETLGSESTYLPAGLGGCEGRALIAGDTLEIGPIDKAPAKRKTPKEFRPRVTNSWALRACEGAEIEMLDTETRFDLFDTNFRIGNRADRMGLHLKEARLRVSSAGRLASAPVFPGTIQCPQDGQPFLLGVDAQTTGGYPRVAQVARVDRHLIGQLRPGARLRLLWREPEAAIADLRGKLEYWGQWLPDISRVI
jgi:biotin-dependent carboxylase-like uncharacterized protein